MPKSLLTMALLKSKGDRAAAQLAAQKPLILLENGEKGSVADLKNLNSGAIIYCVLRPDAVNERSKIIASFVSVYTCAGCNPDSDCSIHFSILNVSGPKIEFWENGHEVLRHLSAFASVRVLFRGVIVVEIIRELCEDKHKLALRLAGIEKRIAEFFTY